MPTLLTHGVKALSLAALLGAATTAPATAQTVYGLQLALPSTFSLVTFQATAPGTFTATAPITGLASGQALVGLDTRPNTGELFALGYNNSAASGTANAQVYRLATTGALTAVGSPITLALGADLLPKIGFDFNPTVDRIRVTAANGANYRLNPVTGGIAATDGNLAYATTDTNTGQTPGVGASAYTNSYIGSTATTLYNVDETASRLVSQNPPNDGTLNTIGALGVTVNGLLQTTDLDIAYTGGQNVAYLSVATAQATGTATSQLYTVNLTTGVATAVGTLGSANASSGISDIAVAIDRTVPATVTGQLAYALAGTNLVTFDTAVPGTIRTSLGITGVDASQTLVGLDVRPATNTLYALGYNAAATGTTANAQIYTVNGATGVARAVGTAVRLELGMGSIGFDFNPTVDRIRVVGANRANYRLNPADGTISATDGTLAFAGGTGTPSIGAVAYTNSFMGASATSTTTLYDYDQGLNNLYTQAPPNDGTLNLVGSSGITVNSGTPNVDLDIYSPAAGTNTAYLVANTGTSANTSLYTVNLTTGAATLVGAIGQGLAARNIAIAGAAGVVTAARPTELATDFSLFPNPLASTTSLSFGLPRAARVELLVTDALGRQVDALDAGLLPAGAHTVRWSRGSQAAGLYFFRLRFDGQPAGTRQAALTQ
ncbi:DUF4394 domain-containing protein [Hymenobacter sp. RP-2-7]|uniref:DUF4394 domain-containing protein n=1 Tax=Hymenobacter polaris TaxID=2682546 RepID=A0A7Y0AI70_9BACT|nr:DUF4394 domain-containing protein [Hymenobacter polaris]NML67765.1 DUF4394 domain-containing protein [Hymenobacter polaris]